MNVNEGSLIAPWDELSAFDFPLQTTQDASTLPGGVLLKANPNRIAILFANPGGGPVNISLKPFVGPLTSNGLQVLTTTNPFWIMHTELPGMPQSQWFANAMAAGSFVTTIEIVLSKWPIGNAPVIRRRQVIQQRTNGIPQWPSPPS